MQALSGLWAQQFGTPNWAAHGGFCSVNMAVAGLYTIGYSFWEFGAPDWDHAKYFVLWGVAEDHSSNPIKIGLEQAQAPRREVRVGQSRSHRIFRDRRRMASDPARHRWTAGAVDRCTFCSSAGLIDWEFLIRYTNAPWLVVQTPGHPGDGLFARDADDNPLVWDQQAQRLVNGLEPEIAPALFATVKLDDGRVAKTVFSLAAERYLDDRYAPETVARECGVPAETIVRIAHEMAHVAFNEAVELPIRWTDMHGRTHDKRRRTAGGDARDARNFRTLQRVPHVPRAASASDAAGRARRTRELPREGTVSAPHPDALASGKRSRGDLRAEHGVEAHAQRQSHPARGSGDRQGRCAAAHRQGLLLGERRFRRTA